MSAVVEQALRSPAAPLAVTLGAYLIGQGAQKMAKGHLLVNPVVIAIAIVVAVIHASGIGYGTYSQGVSLINTLLGPATVALAFPLYRGMAVIRRNPLAITLAILTTVVISASVACLLAHGLGASPQLQLSITLKSVTTPVAIGIAEKIQAVPSLVVLFVFSTGILGSVVAGMVFSTLRLKDEEAIGLALGATCHGLGVALALQRSERAGALSVLGMSLMGMFSALLLPWALLHLIASGVLGP